MRVSVSRRKIRAAYAVVFATAGMLLGSCGSVSEVEKSSRDQAEAVSQELARLLGKDEPRWSSVRVSERPWLGIEPVQSDERENLPAALEGADAVTLPLSDVESDEVLASRIEAAAKTTETGSETTLKPGEVSSGFGLSYTARITAPDEVLVRLVVSLRDRPTFAVFGTSQAQIQLPVYADRGVQATQRLRRGETLIVAGFSDRVGSTDEGGTFDEQVPLPDGHRRASGFRQEQVLLLTAEIGEPLGVSETSETEL